MVVRFIKFGLVGGLAFCIDFSLTALLHEVLGVGPYISNVIGFCTSASVNYTLNRIWTFKSKNPNVRGEALRFLLVSIMGLGLNNLILAGYMELIGIGFHVAGYYFSDFWIAKVLATGVVMFWNFFINKHFTFKK